MCGLDAGNSVVMSVFRFVVVASAVFLLGVCGVEGGELPKVCAAYEESTFDCNCVEVCSSTCYSDCSASFSSCKHKCKDCWCHSIGCNCCGSGKYPCDCGEECEECTETICSRWEEYDVTGVGSLEADVDDAEAQVLVFGATFAAVAPGQSLCRWFLVSGGAGPSNVDVNATVLSPGVVRCEVPGGAEVEFGGGSGSAEVELSVSLDGGAGWTPRHSSVVVRLFRCEGGCGHGTCVGGEQGAVSCACNHGWAGEKCEERCPEDGAGKVCGGEEHGSCLPSGQCACVDGWGGDACDEPEAKCPRGYVPPACSVPCPGSSECRGAMGCGVVCSGRGECGAQGCLCNGTMGYFGAACNTPCPAPASGGGKGMPCGGHGSCTHGGSCVCDSGFYGSACGEQCPGGATTPCSDRGICDSSSGSCSCRAGFAGEDCSQLCPGTHGCSKKGGCGTVCSGHGACLASAHCQCRQGWWGEDCSQECPGGTGANACSGHGTCVSDGTCHCIAGFAGPTCEEQCPRGSSGGEACGGEAAGVCEWSGGGVRCKCNPTYAGAACDSRYCIPSATPCYGRGNCTTDGSGEPVCSCDPGFAPPWCAHEQHEAAAGSLRWADPLVEAFEDSGTVVLNVSRSGGVRGEVSVRAHCVPVTAKLGVDFECSDKQLRWVDGDAGDKQFAVAILDDSRAENTLAFDVVLLEPQGGAMLGAFPNATISIRDSDQQNAFAEAALVRVRLLVPHHSIQPGTDAGAHFQAAFTADLATALSQPRARFVIQDVLPSSGGAATFVAFLILPPSSSYSTSSSTTSTTSSHAPTANKLATALLKQIGNPSSSLYGPDRTWTPKLDLSWPVQVSFVHEKPGSKHGSSSTPANPISPLSIGIGVLIPVICLAALAAAAYARRRQLSEWVLYAAGNMRFSPLATDDRHPDIDLHIEMSGPTTRSAGRDREGGGGGGVDDSDRARLVTPDT